MDIIQKAIERKQHISPKEDINRQSWEEFEVKAKSHKVLLFGAASCAGIVLETCKNILIEGVIDNDVKKQGFYLEDFVEEARNTEYGKLKIAPLEMFEKYSDEEILVLITSTNYYWQIMEQLERIGIRNYYVALIMEANRRESCRIKSTIEDKNYQLSYARDCCKKEIISNKILFYSFGTYSDHGKYITEALLRIRLDIDIVWIVKDLRMEVPRGVRKVYMGNWKRYVYEMETSKIWIYNMVVPSYIIKRPEQIYIQTKHWASVTLKRFYLDAATIQNVRENVENWNYNSEIMDYIITGSDFDTESSRRGFGFKKEVLQIGSPRSDALFRATEYRKKIYGVYRMDEEYRTLIYAPTYRFDKSSTNHQHELRAVELDFDGVREALEKRFGGSWYIMLRLHPSVAKESKKFQKSGFIIDASDYVDGEELVAASDIMISDYSSIMFEPAFVKKPVFLFATDRETYIDKEYDLLIDYETLPFPIAESNEELLKNIELFDGVSYEKNLEMFMEKYGVHEDGHASERAAQFVSALIDGKRM
jgi:CDP-glycerol glycerophosphotransferase (TagB/SpsB family)